MTPSPRPPGARKQRPLENHDEPTDSVKAGHFHAADGTRLFYSSEGKGRPLVFCYGLVCSVLHWTYQIEHFKKSHQTTWMDYRGHQGSEAPKDLNAVTLDILADDLYRLLEEANIEKATFLGHSMGVNVVLEFYRKYPHKVEAIILANGTPRNPLESLLLNNALEPAFNFLTWVGEKQPKLLQFIWKNQKANPIVHKMIGLLGFNSDLTPKEDIAQYVDQFADLDPRLFLKLIGTYRNYDCTSWLHEVKVPTLIIAGEKDWIVPKHQQELFHQLIPDSEFHVIKSGSHCPQMDMPELVSGKIETFLKKHGLEK
jgi:pimeloyl-ACP methyl ester carboxylesterase